MSKFIIALCILAVACSAQASEITAAQITELAKIEGQKYVIYKEVFELELNKAYAKATKTAKSVESSIQWKLEAALDKLDDINSSTASDFVTTVTDAAANATACVKALKSNIDANTTSLQNELYEFSQKVNNLTSIAAACESDPLTEYDCVVESVTDMADELTPQWPTLGRPVTKLLEYINNFKTMAASCVKPFKSVLAKIDGIADTEDAYSSSEEATSSSDSDESSSSFDLEDSYARSDSEDSSSSSASDDLYSSFDSEDSYANSDSEDCSSSSDSEDFSSSSDSEDSSSSSASEDSSSSSASEDSSSSSASEDSSSSSDSEDSS